MLNANNERFKEYVLGLRLDRQSIRCLYSLLRFHSSSVTKVPLEK